jgi:hypothetical protein
MSNNSMPKIAEWSTLASLVLALSFWTAGQLAEAAGPGSGVVAVVASPASVALEKAAKGGKYLFLFFWRDDNQQSRLMRGVLRSAMTKVVDRADAVEIQADDPAEKQIATRYGVSRAPMPLVLAIAPNGAITKGLPSKCDENQLLQAFVSRGTADCMKALQDRKFVLLCVDQPSPQTGKVSLPAGVKDFAVDQQYAPWTSIVALDPRDPAETPFLKSLQVNPQAASPVTVLMVPPGTVAGTFASDVTKEQLIAKVKAAQAGCGAGCSCHH